MDKNADKIKYFRKIMEEGTHVAAGSPVFEMFHAFSQDALKLTAELNSKYHTPDEIRSIFSKLTKSDIDSSFGLFPPFYTDCGINIKIGKNVFINACCKFQDQGGIEINDGVLIGHNVTIATLNHDINPSTRASLTPKKVVIKKNAWIGSDSTILPGITIGEGAIVGAGSVVTKDVPDNIIVAGNPAKIIRKIEK